MASDEWRGDVGPALFASRVEALDLACGRVAFRRLGSGPDLILLHGLLGSGRQWQPAAELLARSFTCWILELPGISESEAVADGSLTGLSRWLGDVVRGLGREQFSLIGSSWGGAVAMEFAATSAERKRLRRLVLAAPAHPYWIPSRRQRWLLWPPLLRIAVWCARGFSADACRQLVARSYGRMDRVPPDAGERYRTLLHRAGIGAALAGYARDWGGEQRRLGAVLKQIEAPTLLVWGERDVVVPLASVAPLRQHLPGCQWAWLPGLGHLPYEEDPAAFVHAVEPFLTAT